MENSTAPAITPEFQTHVDELREAFKKGIEATNHLLQSITEEYDLEVATKILTQLRESDIKVNKFYEKRKEKLQKKCAKAGVLICSMDDVLGLIIATELQELARK